MSVKTGLATAAAILCVPGMALAADSIVFATDWKAQAEHGGFYQALATGLYEEAGLDVSIRMGGPGVDNQQLMAAGAVDLAMGSNNFFPMNLQMAGADVLAVAATFQKSPQVLMTHPRDDVDKLAHMAGKPVMIADSSINTFWVWLKAAHGFEDSQIRKYTFNMAPWLVDTSAIQQGYLSSEPFLVQKEGIEPEVYLLADYGYPDYAALILAPGETVREQPDKVQRFVDASIKGWYSYLYGDPSPANALIKADNPDMTDDTIANAIVKMKEFEILEGGAAAELGIGAMTDERWSEFFELMAANGIYPADFDYTSAYTLDFVNKKVGMDMKP